jgi:outer membrane receptor protein involved in Fe transport
MNLYPDEDHRPSYYDIFSRVQYEVRPGHRLSAHILHAGDDNRGMESDSTIYRVRYGNSYGWMNWEADFGSALSARTVASLGRVTQDREGTDFADLPQLRVDDENTTWILGLRQDWQYRHSPRMMLKWGLDLRRSTADYDYDRASFGFVPNFTDPSGPDMWPRHDTVEVDLSRSGYEAGAYVADRIQLTDALTVEAGLRFDHQSVTGEQQVSPRLSAAVNLTPRTTLRGAWGHYHQSHALHELWAADRDTTSYPAQKAEHRIVGLEHRFGDDYALRLEAYQRRLSNPLPEYRRIARNMGTLWEEQPDDRIFVHPERGRAEGLELFLKSPPDRRLSWSGSYALSRVEEEVDGAWVPRPFDQRHAVNLQVAFRPTPDWTVAVGWIYHSPWPYTEVEYTYSETVHGEPVAIPSPGVLNQERMIPYKRIDLRVSRRLRLGRNDVLLYLDVFNLLNWENALDYEQYARWTGSGWMPREELFPQLWIMPSLGARWSF